jgi:hypothetical protein
VRSIVNKIGPELFKNFDKLRLIMRQGSHFGSPEPLRSPNNEDSN